MIRQRILAALTVLQSCFGWRQTMVSNLVSDEARVVIGELALNIRAV
jgi:hypothetical protein